MGSILVSILVLLEPPLILEVSKKVDAIYQLFQSLFYWNLLSYLSGSAKYEGQKKFQSLFYWNLLSYRYLTHPSLPYRCFNPCFTGTSSHTIIYFNRCPYRVLFQSLFYWNLLSYSGEREVRIPNICRFQSLFYWNLLSYSIFILNH